MPGWRDKYLLNLQEAQRNNPVNRDLVEACSQLADRVAILEAEKSSKRALADPLPTKVAATDGPAATASPQVRLELAEALRSKGQLQSRLKAAENELIRLRVRTTEDARTLRTLGSERKHLVVRLRDRDDELRQKNKLVADVQDELAVLNLQLDLAERERAKAKEETKQLVDRWMRKMGQEADEMNLANEPEMKRNR